MTAGVQSLQEAGDSLAVASSRGSAATVSVTCNNTGPHSVGIAAGSGTGPYTSADTGIASGPTRRLTIQRPAAASAAGSAMLTITY